ncbi:MULTISPECIES: LacI family DNA-binding transcriptional regulator [unclassified Arthrobacter]|uniref:LacI family DNA-binding transcriptional regulator n=1 Tax=unclassified Arthrobacter TaxID=235627 RepID=UPI00159D1515|nr:MULTISPECIES: LacI family DNA-binding transcriptional regulator [unclassified Arthrobacter]MCQ9162764.1 LacI family DNA-binding transcriptional regulator [Arthrobacter sp. STN4]NVM97253.1 LacI family transcriptional regulator [Arthrobacter sp. SDTb3-6]
MSEKSQRSKPVLATVAALAGVSAPTVSKVINGRDDVAAGTRARVQEALERLGYESPVQRRSRSAGPAMVELVFDGINTQYSLEVLTGILDYASAEGVEIVLSSVTPRKLHNANHEEWAQRMVESGRKGLVLVTSEVTGKQLDSFKRRSIPVVVIDPLNPPHSGFVSVGATNWAGGKAATEHLIALGHERIAYLGGPEAAECSVARLHGYLAALMGHGIPARPGYALAGGFNQAFGASGAANLLALPEPPTAIFAGSDDIALGVLDEARRQNVRVPEDISLVGFDGTALAEQTLPRLTSVAQPLKEMGRAALRSVLRLAKGETLDSLHVELATELVVRDSTAVPPGP